MNLAFPVQDRSMLRKIEWRFPATMLALNLFGLLNVYSATHSPFSQGVETLFINQILWLIIGWSVFLIITFVDYQVVSRLAYLIYALNLGAVLYVTFFGKVALGAQRWIDFGFFRYQPSETMKLAMVIVLAHIFSRRPVDPGGMGLKELALPLILFAIPFGLVMEQPDLGTAMMIAAVSGSIILFMSVKRWILVGAAALFVFTTLAF